MSYYDPPRNPLPAHRQVVRSPYGTPGDPLNPRYRRPRRGLFTMILLPAFGIGAVAIVGESLTADDPYIGIQSGIGFAVHDGEDLVLVPYDRTGTAGFLDKVTHDPTEVRVAAIELDSGDNLWDVQISDEIGWNAAVIAAGETYAYLATDDGLTVLDLDNGAVAAEPGRLLGLEAAQSASGAAYAFDPELQAVVALDVNGTIHTIALDTLEAVTAGADTVATWSGLLFAEGTVPDIGGLTSTEALLADGESSVRIEPTAEGAAGGSLILDGPGGEQRALGTRIYYGGAIVLDQTDYMSTFTVDIDVDELIDDFLEDPAAAGKNLWTGLGNTAAGAGGGHVLVEHQREPNVQKYALNVVSLETGQVTASLDTGINLGRAVTSASGHTAVIAAPADSTWLSDLVIVAPDGSVNRVELADVDFFGNPG